VAIGNSGDGAAMAALDEVSPARSSADDPVVQEHILWAKIQP
jgi:hypothetical protein